MYKGCINCKYWNVTDPRNFSGQCINSNSPAATAIAVYGDFSCPCFSSSWMPCKLHLPEEGEGTKWVTVKGHDVISCRPGESIAEAVKRVSNIRWVGQAFYDHEEEMWLDPGYGVPLMVQPIAWMDIEYPEPYEGEV